MTSEQKREEKQQLLLRHIQEMSYFDDEFMVRQEVAVWIA